MNESIYRSRWKMEAVLSWMVCWSPSSIGNPIQNKSLSNSKRPFPSGHHFSDDTTKFSAGTSTASTDPPNCCCWASLIAAVVAEVPARQVYTRLEPQHQTILDGVVGSHRITRIGDCCWIMTINLSSVIDQIQSTFGILSVKQSKKEKSSIVSEVV